MEAFELYSRELENLALKLSDPSTGGQFHLAISDILDRQLSQVLRSLVPLSELRQTGAFFTDHQLAGELVKSITPEIERGATVIDPACGLGDLLLACARHFPILEDLGSTLEEWSHKLKGCDLYPQFIRATKARLVLLAIGRGAQAHSTIPTFKELFPQIGVCDSLSPQSRIPTADCIVINPPYSMVPAPDECTWTAGSVSQAALFLEKCIEDASPGTKIVAILPDVLRTGSRYLKWRNHIENNARVESIEIVGRFDALTDIDVFIARLTVGANEHRRGRDWWNSDPNIETPAKTVGDYFEVRVGPVVPYRDPLEGPSYPYIHAQQLPTWESIEADFSFRKFTGTTFVPPFVVVRRTSRPGDKHRAVGTIITGKDPVAVENHLLVLKPKSGSVDDCLQLLNNLRSPKTNTWLNERIRCRHLTVSALRALPWWVEE